MKLKLGTRGSDLALTQSRWVAAELARAGVETELVIISTSGDRSQAPSFGAIGPQGVFVREIEQALSAGAIDIAVHSYKDLPTTSPAGLFIAAVPPRRDPADWLFARKAEEMAEKVSDTFNSVSDTFSDTLLRAGARVGTSSARRQAWLRHWHPDVVIEPLRGNVPTRLKRLADGDFDAILLAGAGVERLSEASAVLDDALAHITRLRLDPERFVPAPAQGALALQCRDAAPAIRAALGALDDAETRVAVTLERAALALAEGGCDTAFGAYARRTNGDWRLDVMLERSARVGTAHVTGRPDAGLAADAMTALARAAERAS
jgi:hydroxymethylbilane synthase